MPKTIDILVDYCVKNIIPPIPVLGEYFGPENVCNCNEDDLVLF
jgi:hypothetical protein